MSNKHRKLNSPRHKQPYIKKVVAEFRDENRNAVGEYYMTCSDLAVMALFGKRRQL